MPGTTPDEEHRHEERAERLRREAARRRRQLVAVPVVLVALLALMAVLAWRPAAPSGAGPAQAASVAATSVPTQAGEPTAAVEPTGSAVATGSVDASRSAESTSGAVPSKTATGAAIAAIKPLRPAPGVKTIVVDKSDQQVTLYTAKGTPVDTFRCASGITYPRVGTYHVYGHRKQSWSMYDASTFYYFTMFVKSDKGNNIGFHSIPVMPDGKLVGKLGVPVSHGCVRLDKAKAKLVYAWATVGTKVVVKR